VEFVDLTFDTIDEVYNIEAKSFKTPWSKSQFQEEITNQFAKYFCLKMDDKIVGYIGMWQILDEGHITNVAVLEDYRKCGFGERLINRLIKYAKEKKLIFLTLEVRITNIPAISLYEKCGFKKVGTRKNYYENSIDAILMTLDLR
jgi:ribosomal-protein-alanine N-acetyltransferase